MRSCTEELSARFLVIPLVLFLAGCAQLSPYQEPAPTEAKAGLRPTQGNDVSGVVQFAKVEEGVRVTASLTGLSPGKHGFHIHEKGDCSAPDASSAGGHFNPEGTSHGGPDNPADKRHVGDLGNIRANQGGNAYYNRVDSVIALRGDRSITGKAVVVHAGTDDLSSQPSGAAGPRVACGVIQAR